MEAAILQPQGSPHPKSFAKNETIYNVNVAVMKYPTCPPRFLLLTKRTLSLLSFVIFGKIDVHGVPTPV